MNFQCIRDLADLPVNYNDVLLIPILEDATKHRCQTTISFIYWYDITTRQEYIINFNHSDYPKTVNLQLISEKILGKIYAYNRSYIFHYFPEAIEINLLYWMMYNEAMDIEFTSEINQYHRWYFNIESCNNIIPLMNWISYCRNVRVQCILVLEDNIPDKEMQFYNNIVQTNLINLENSGLYTNSNLTNTFIKKEISVLYTQYNLYTSTGRPSNHYGGINFAALDKKNGIRSMFKSRFDNGWLVEFDYESMHVRLTADLIKHVLPPGNLHEYFGRFYFKTPVLDEETYEKSKSITWHLLYGNIGIDYLHIPFFKSVLEYRKKIWSEFNSIGYIRMPISGRKLLKSNYTDLTQNKLFNYLLQGYETEYNALMLEKLFIYLYKRKSKLILYTYDSFLFDFHPDDGDSTIDDIKNILQGSGIDVKMKYGRNYHRMKQ